MRYIRTRLLATLPVLLGVSLLVFVSMRVTAGDPVQIMTGEISLTPEHRAELEHQLGLDRPVVVQFLDFLWRAMRGDLGRSIRYKLPVLEVILQQLPATLELTVTAMLFAMVIGGLAGIVAALHQNTMLDYAIMGIAVIGLCLPSFWLGLLLIFFFSLRLGWLPATGTGGVEHLILPVFTLGIIYAGTIARLTRSSMLEALNEDYITTARAKGLAERVVVLRHALKNALIPVVTVISLQFGALMGGAVITETVFARQGLGRLTVSAILDKDYPIVQGAVLLICVGFVLINLAVDLLYTWIDPRIRQS